MQSNQLSNVSQPFAARLVEIEILRMGCAAAAVTCMRWLRTQGFEVIKVCESRHLPRIYIRACGACEKLEGAVRVYERAPGIERRCLAVMRHDCEIRWADAGGNA